MDLVRFGAIEAMGGATAAPGAASLSGSKAGSSREDTVQRQRRGRAWRLLVAQAGVQVGLGEKSRVGWAARVLIRKR